MQVSKGMTARWTQLLALLLTALCLSSAVQAQDRAVEWQGFINSLPTGTSLVGDWKVNNRTVRVSSTTTIKQERGKAEVGAYVEVKGTAPSGTDTVITATSVEVKYRAGNGAPVEIKGTIESLPSTTGRVGDWKISGKTVKVTSTTRLVPTNAQFAVGGMVEGAGLQMADGTITATMLVLKPEAPPTPVARFAGLIEKLPTTEKRLGDWTISGRVVRVTDKTEISGTPAVGSLAQVEGARTTDGVFTASKIEIKALPPIPQIVTFKGTVETLPGTTGLVGDWKISGRTVTVGARTLLRPNATSFKVGSYVEVFGMKTGDSPVAATWIELKNEIEANPNFTRFYGTIKSLPSASNLQGEWNVDGKTVIVGATTKINQERAQAAVGAFVEVEGLKQADGKIAATEIEVQRGLTLGFVRFSGFVEILPSGATKVGDWTVSKRVVHVTDKTKIDETKKAIAVGSFVEISGNLRTDGSLDATSIEAKSDPGLIFTSFVGTINTLPTTADKVGVWKINERNVNVTKDTKINQERGQAIVGATVEVKGTVRTDGTIDATSIEVKQTTPNGGGLPQLMEFTGKIVSLPANAQNFVGEWKVDDKVIRVTGRTQINRQRGAVAIGATVKVKGVQIGTNPIDAISIEVQPSASSSADFTANTPLASVNASSYVPESASDSIIAAFGSNLSRTTQAATTLPLPTELGGVTVLVDGHPAGLFFVSPNQINYLVPPGLQPGVAQVTVEVNDEVVAQGSLLVDDVAPGLFTADASGRGVPAGLLLRVANGQQVYESLARNEGGRMVPVPVVQRADEALYLVLYGAGLRGASVSQLEVTVGDKKGTALYVGAAPRFAGLDQLNIQLPANLPAGPVNVTVKVNDGEGNLLTANVVTITVQ